MSSVQFTYYIFYKNIFIDTSRNTRPSDSSADVDVIVTQKFTKMALENSESVAPPPRPPKPPQYFNLMPAPAARNRTSSNTEKNANASESKVNCRKDKISK